MRAWDLFDHVCVHLAARLSYLNYRHSGNRHGCRVGVHACVACSKYICIDVLYYPKCVVINMGAHLPSLVSKYITVNEPNRWREKTGGVDAVPPPQQCW